MSLVTLLQAKLHLRVDGTHEDSLIQLFIDAAEQSTADYLERGVYADADALAAPGADPNGIVVNPAIVAAVLLQVGHLYANREAVTPGSASELPLGVKHLLQPHRHGTGV